jgi:hypothetical protein
VPPILPAPMRAILLRAMGESFRGRNRGAEWYETEPAETLPR